MVSSYQVNKAEKEMYIEKELERLSDKQLISIAKNNEGARSKIARRFLNDRGVNWD